MVNNFLVKRFKNGNLSIRFSSAEIQDIKSNACCAIEVLGSALCECGFYLNCSGNNDATVTAHNFNFNKLCIVRLIDVTNVLMAGKTLRLYATTPTADDL